MRIINKYNLSFPSGASDKEFTCQCGKCKRQSFNPWVRKIPWRRKWQPTPVFLPGESHGQRTRRTTVHGVTELDTSEHLNSSSKCKLIQEGARDKACYIVFCTHTHTSTCYYLYSYSPCERR